MNKTFRNGMINQHLLDLGFEKLEPKVQRVDYNQHPLFTYRNMLVTYRTIINGKTCYAIILNKKIEYIYTQDKFLNTIEKKVLQIQQLFYEPT